MQNTKLLYLQDMAKLTAQAYVQAIHKQDYIYTLVLDQTIFYPQGGGQPSDKGSISNGEALFEVHTVSLENGIVYHKGLFKYEFVAIGTQVTLRVDKELREIHNRNHTAGHLIDYALYTLGYRLKPTKGYHFPQGPYVEYESILEQSEREKLQVALEKAVNDLIERALPVKIMFLENNPQKRVMYIDGHEPIFCGGTHVSNTQDIREVTIRKIKNEKGNLRICYAVN